MPPTRPETSVLKLFDDAAGFADGYLARLEEMRASWVAQQLTYWRPMHDALAHAIASAAVPGSGYAIAMGDNPQWDRGSSNRDGTEGDLHAAHRGNFHASVKTLVGDLRASQKGGRSFILLSMLHSDSEERDGALSYKKGVATLLGNELGRSLRHSLVSKPNPDLQQQVLAALARVEAGEQPMDDVLEAAAALLSRDRDMASQRKENVGRASGVLEAALPLVEQVIADLTRDRPEAAALLFGDGHRVVMTEHSVDVMRSQGESFNHILYVRPSFSYETVPPLVVDLSCADMRVTDAVPSYPDHENADEVREWLDNMGDRKDISLETEGFRTALFSMLGMIARVGGGYRPTVVQEEA